MRWLARAAQLARGRHGAVGLPQALYPLLLCPGDLLDSVDDQRAHQRPSVHLTLICVLDDLFLSVSLSLCLSVSLSRCLAVSLSRCLAVSLSRCLAVSLSLCLSVSLSLCLSVSLSDEQPHERRSRASPLAAKELQQRAVPPHQSQQLWTTTPPSAKSTRSCWVLHLPASCALHCPLAAAVVTKSRNRLMPSKTSLPYESWKLEAYFGECVSETLALLH